MKLLPGAVALLALAVAGPAQAASDAALSSHQILPNTFQPPPVFKNTNLVRNVNLDKGFVKEVVNVVIENVSKEPQNEYFIPFDAATISKVGNLDVREKGDEKKPPMKAEIVEYDPASSTQFYRVTLLDPLAPKAQATLTIAYNVLGALEPMPAQIEQTEKQYLQYRFSEYAHSAYPTSKQRTKLKFPTTDIQDATGKPEKQGSSYTYGPFSNTPAGAESQQSVRYEFTKPLITATRLERDIEVSHWGGNIAFEERYWLTNRGANLREQFSRTKWGAQHYYNPPTSAIKTLTIPLKPGSIGAYYTDEIGNISTSQFRPGSATKEGRLELKPRFPVFGGWNHPFRIGWDNELSRFLRRVVATGPDTYVLNVPFLEGPKMSEGVAYEQVEVRVILPEGATNLRFQTAVPLDSNATSTHKTFMDTLGRSVLLFTAHNLVDDVRDSPLLITYEYSSTAMLRKPLTIFAGLVAVFSAAWVIGQLDVSIGRKTKEA